MPDAFMDKLHKSLQGWAKSRIIIFMAIPHNSKCRYGERGAADAKPKAQIILDAAKVSAASGGNSRNPTLSSILATQMPCRSCRSGA